jgi:pyruvate kinase
VKTDTTRRTKIVCTIGPATSSEAQLGALIESGMNVARVNFAHGTPADHRTVIARIRSLAERIGTPVAILQDLAGPKVRVGAVADGSVVLHAGDPFTLTTRAITGDRRRVSVSYSQLPREVKAHDRLLLADGAIELRVQEVTDEDILCHVVVGGTLGSRKGVNCPAGLLGVPILGEKDLQDLRVGVEAAVDYVGLSFVRTAADVRTAKAVIAGYGSHTPVIAKIETRAALEHLDAILAEADGMMIARGDLSIETPFTRVPIVQKQLIAKANQSAKPVITATQMLFSMVSAPRPTRAEVADVANAILDGSDAVMLSEETAVGRDPVAALQTMVAIAVETEHALPAPAVASAVAEPRLLSETEAVVQAACQLAARLQVDVITTMTRSGETARFAAKYRPSQPILALTMRPDTYRRLALVRGVVPLLLSAPVGDTADTFTAARQLTQRHGWQGKRAVFVSNDTLRTGVL